MFAFTGLTLLVVLMAVGLLLVPSPPKETTRELEAPTTEK